MREPFREAEEAMGRRACARPRTTTEASSRDSTAAGRARREDDPRRAVYDPFARLESLFRLPPSAAAAALGELVLETRELVRREFPALALQLARGLDERVEPWPLPGPALDPGAA